MSDKTRAMAPFEASYGDVPASGSATADVMLPPALPYDGVDGTGAARGAGGGREHRQGGLLRAVHRSLRGRYWLVVPMGLILGAAGAVGGWKVQAPTYRSEGAVQIDYKLPNRPSLDGNPGDTGIGMYEEFMASQYYILTSRRVLGLAMHRPEWAASGRAVTPEAIDKFADELLVEHPRGTQSLHIAFTDKNPALAAAAVQSLIYTYKELYESRDDLIGNSALNALGRGADDKRAEIKRERDYIKAEAAEFGTEDLEPLFKSQEEQYIAAEARLNEAVQARELRKGSADVGKIIDQLTDAQIGMMDAPMAVKMTALATAETELERLKLNAGPNNTRVRELEINIEHARTAVQQYGKEYRALQHKLAEATGSVSNAPQVAGIGPKLAMSVEALEKEVETLRKTAVDRRQEMTQIGLKAQSIREHQENVKRLTAELQAIQHEAEVFKFQITGPGRFQIANAGEIPVKPYKDNRAKFAALGGMTGMMLPVGMCLLMGLMKRRYRYSDDADGADGMPPLLGILPALPDKLTDPEQAAIAAHCVHQLRIMLQVNASAPPADRGFDDGRGRLAGGWTPRSYVITSGGPGDGKTSLTMALGFSFAASGSRTLVIDCDMIGQGLTTRLKAGGSEGLQEALYAGTLHGRVKKTTTPNLYILPIGGADGAHAGVISPASIRKLLVEARRIFEVVLIDTGPVLGSLEAQVVAGAVDATILTIARGQDQTVVRRAVKMLRQVGANVVGMVFNRAEHRDFERSVGHASIKSMATVTQPQRPLVTEGADESRFGPLARSVASFMPPQPSRALPAGGKPLNGNGNGNGKAGVNGKAEHHGNGAADKSDGKDEIRVAVVSGYVNEQASAVGKSDEAEALDPADTRHG